VSLDDVRLWLVEFCGSYNARLHYDPSQEHLMVEQLRGAGVTCEEFTFTSSSVAVFVAPAGATLCCRRHSSTDGAAFQGGCRYRIRP
jgi:hypothetical protein